jgi:hypothetical protein
MLSLPHKVSDMSSTHKSSSPKVWVKFAFFNFFVFAAVFLGRIMRDAILFSSEHGAYYFPVILVFNAVLMTWFAGWMDKRLERSEGLPTLVRWGFLWSAFWFIAWGVVGIFFAIPTYMVAFFYLGSEIPIFLGMNLIWIIAADYFTDQQGQRNYPRISGVGQFGMAFGSVLIILHGMMEPLNVSTGGIKQSSFTLVIIWGVLYLVLWRIAEKLQNLPKLDTGSLDIAEEFDVEDSSSLNNFWQETKINYRWIQKIPFLWLFALVTVCNFALLAIFDATLANGAAYLKVGDIELRTMLAWATVVLGIIAGVYQLSFFPGQLEKKGVATMNLFAPSLMLIGVVVYFTCASDFSLKMWGEVKGTWLKDHLLSFLILARICGWGAEFLFNQSLLPLIYNRLPATQVNRGRFFIEGPLTAITNGVVGVFLFGYFIMLEDSSSLGGTTLDLLYTIALLAGVFMWYWSMKMKPEFYTIMKERLLEKEMPESTIDHIKINYQLGQKEIFEQIDESLGQGTALDVKLVELLVRLPVEGVEEKLSALLESTQQTKATKAAILKGLVEVSGIQTFNNYLSRMSDSSVSPVNEPIDTLVHAAEHFGQTAHLTKLFENWIKKDDAIDTDTMSHILFNLAKMSLDGALAVNKYLQCEVITIQNTSSAQIRHRADLLIRIGSGKYYPDLAKAIRVIPEEQLVKIDWKGLGKINFSSHAQVLDAFSLMLGVFEDPEAPVFKGIQSIIKRYSWLQWLVIMLIEHNKQNYENNRTLKLSYAPFFLANEVGALMPTGLNLLYSAGDEISEACAPELAEIFKDYVKKDSNSPHIQLSELEMLLDADLLRKDVTLADLKSYWEKTLCDDTFISTQIGLALSIATNLFNTDKPVSADTISAWTDLIDHVREHYLLHLQLLQAYKQVQCEGAESWLERRVRQYLHLYIAVIACQLDGDHRQFNPERIATNLFNNTQEIRDRALTQLQQEFANEHFLVIKNSIASFFDPEEHKLKPFIPEIRTLLSKKNEACQEWAQKLSDLTGDQMLKGLIQTGK